MVQKHSMDVLKYLFNFTQHKRFIAYFLIFFNLIYQQNQGQFQDPHVHWNDEVRQAALQGLIYILWTKKIHCRRWVDC